MVTTNEGFFVGMETLAGEKFGLGLFCGLRVEDERLPVEGPGFFGGDCVGIVPSYHGVEKGNFTQVVKMKLLRLDCASLTL